MKITTGLVLLWIGITIYSYIRHRRFLDAWARQFMEQMKIAWNYKKK
jgi:hypothetical protein